MSEEAPAAASEDAFTTELRWCIAQLELGLKRSDCTPEQAADSRKVLTTLRSKKAPLVKKRFIMQKTFGDYRKLMKSRPVPADILAAVIL